MNIVSRIEQHTSTGKLHIDKLYPAHSLYSTNLNALHLQTATRSARSELVNTPS